ncbi:hypothetical protein KAJ41_00190 [Candidatus Parcubacteria bacterium]|nr:hypothetical protein [Candidatus Parcubacteria bacterium]
MNLVFYYVIGVMIILLSLAYYANTKNEAISSISAGIGTGVVGVCFVIDYLTDHLLSNSLLVSTTLVLAVLFLFNGIYLIGTGNPRTFIPKNAIIHIIQLISVHDQKIEGYHLVVASIKEGGVFTKPRLFKISETKFNKKPYKGSILKADKIGHLRQYRAK